MKRRDSLRGGPALDGRQLNLRRLAAAIIGGLLCSLPSARAHTPDFDREVRPILQRCVTCHGPGAAEAGLRLHTLDGATAALPSGTVALAPGDPAASELLRRVASDDPSVRMPPQGERLSESQVATLTAWIADGAAWAPHWAYRPLVRPEVPAADPACAAANAVDAFIQARLREVGLSPSPPADKRTLLRRVTFDLLGLPPTPEETAAFLADDAADAYERVVERLLASPHYGERWARHWMDVVHFAETHGHDQDRPRPNAWPYRDYLIRAFNEDRPYARFIEEQIAGDVLYPDDPQALVATGMLAAGPWDESSLRDIREDTLDREIARYLDRDDIVSTVVSTFLSTTIHCARCHDHKFDPLTQADYYGLQAVFAATDKSDRPYDPDPAIARQRRALSAALAELPALREAAAPELLTADALAAVAQWEVSLGGAAQLWRVLVPQEVRAEQGSTLTPLEDYSVLAGGPRPETDVYEISGGVELPQLAGLRIEVLTDASLPHSGPGRQDNGNLHLSELHATLTPVDATAAASGAPPVKLALTPQAADFDQEGWTHAHAVDGQPATAWGIYPQVAQAHAATYQVNPPAALAGPIKLTVRLEQLHGGGHLIGRVRIALTGAAPPWPISETELPAPVQTALRLPAEQRQPAEWAVLSAYVQSQALQAQLAALPPPQLVYAGSNDFRPDGSFRPAPAPREIFVLHRGLITQPREPASLRALACVPELPAELPVTDPADEGQRRAALARWIADPRNGLAWRSIVNRLWHYHFGQGLVDTPNDFGLMGGYPSHPELLDWLACELLAAGGSLKHIQRLIVTSATYRQASQDRPECSRSDAANRLLWRMPRTRLDAESLRDAVLLVSGKLDRTLYGPSVKQFIESPGVQVTPNVDYANFDPDDPANYRRSVYRFLFRTLPDPFMEALDCADSSQLTPARNVSLTPLQALALLNDKFMVRQSEHLAAGLEQRAPDLTGQIAGLFELALCRRPTAAESAAFVAYAQQHGLANACRVLLNSNEFLFVD